MFGSLRLFFYLDVKPFLKYSPVMLHVTPATRILNEDPENVHQVLTLEENSCILDRVPIVLFG